jgi:hypothetical protein
MLDNHAPSPALAMAYVRKRTTKPARNRPRLLRLTDKSAHPRQRILANLHCVSRFWQVGGRAINRNEGEPEGLSIRLAFVGRFLLLADDDAP